MRGTNENGCDSDFLFSGGCLRRLSVVGLGMTLPLYLADHAGNLILDHEGNRLIVQRLEIEDEVSLLKDIRSLLLEIRDELRGDPEPARLEWKTCEWGDE